MPFPKNLIKIKPRVSNSKPPRPGLSGDHKAAIIGAAIGAPLFTYEHHRKIKKEEASEKFKNSPALIQKTHKAINRLGYPAAVLGGGFSGAVVGLAARNYKNVGKAGSRYPPKPPPDWLQGVKTKNEARKAYRAKARQHHPDLGGNVEDMQRVVSEWENFERHHLNKLSYIVPSFFDEVTKIYGVR